MRKLKLVPILVAMALLVSLGSLQTVNARIFLGRGRISGGGCISTFFYYTVWMPNGQAESNLEWLVDWNVFPVHWWGDPERPVFPDEHYTIGDGLYVCHADWKVYSVVYDDTFRYRWWIIWESEEAAGEPGAESLGGYFIFSHGTGDFEDMKAFGRAWVAMLPGEYFPFGYQYHVGFMFGGPQ